ncbi:MAG: glycoside hydrolase [Actinobacteria bacterium]|nr:glycoside hydrolase [Actinomycetota bacterium]
MDLYKKSIQIIKTNQHKSDSYIASPDFESYRYCWLRDGTFTAYAMDKACEYESAERFHRWVNSVIKRYSYKIVDILKKLNKNENINPNDFLPTRYTLEGYESNQKWANFQLDGYGIWLWGLAQHIKFTGNKNFLIEFKESINIIKKYLSLLWNHNNYDCWEENLDKVHVSTLACIYGGLKEISQFHPNIELSQLTNKIKEFVLNRGVVNNHFVKYIGTDKVDASLLWLSMPFRLVEPNEKVMLNTIDIIEKDLLKNGVYRYRNDTYYGGGEWILLTAWLGWFYTEINQKSKAYNLSKWIESKADKDGNLPEQININVLNSDFYHKWVKEKGKPAKTLL